MKGSRVSHMQQRGQRFAAAVVLCTCTLLMSWGARHVFNGRHTSGMPLEEAIAELQTGKLADNERDLAVRVVRERVLDGIAVLAATPCEIADAALEHVRKAVR